MSRARAVREWTRRGIDKFYLGFIIPDRISKYYSDYEPFFYGHGLEMMCKAYIIGTKFPAYKNKTFSAAKREIDRIGRSLSHNLERPINKLIELNVLPADFLSVVYCRMLMNNVELTNRDMLKTLNSAYLEARYPVPILDCQRYYEEKIKGNPKAENRGIVEIPILSHEVSHFSRTLFRLILARIERDFRLEIPRSKLRDDINDNDWERFSNLFFR